MVDGRPLCLKRKERITMPSEDDDEIFIYSTGYADLHLTPDDDVNMLKTTVHDREQFAKILIIWACVPAAIPSAVIATLTTEDLPRRLTGYGNVMTT